MLSYCVYKVKSVYFAMKINLLILFVDYKDDIDRNEYSNRESRNKLYIKTASHHTLI